MGGNKNDNKSKPKINRLREFSYTTPLMLDGTYYPAQEATITDSNGETSQRMLALDGNDEYFYVKDGQPHKAYSAYTLPEVTVTAPKVGNPLNYLVMNNATTQVNNLPHRVYNLELQKKALEGATEHAAWEKDNPNAAAWSYGLSALPFAVASAPADAGALWAGQTLAGLAGKTALGKAAIDGVSSMVNNPIVHAANNLIGTGFAAKGAYDVSQGTFTPMTMLELSGAYPVGKTLYNAAKSSTRALRAPKFESELDWSPESWFGTRTGNVGYDAQDIAALKSHIPEYHQIEKEAKANGTWLKMPDGSIWQGDPRSWVQLMSKDGSKLQKRIMYHGDSNSYTQNGVNVTPEVLGNKVLWTSTNKHLPLTYGNRHYQLTIPNEVPNVTFNAKGRNYNNLPNKYNNTNELSYDLLRNNNTVTIKDIIDVGNDPRWRPGDKGIPTSFQGEEVFDYYDRVFKGDDIILGKDVPRKSLLGNNGDFDLLNKNIYKGVIPLTLFNVVPQKQ